MRASRYLMAIVLSFMFVSTVSYANLSKKQSINSITMGFLNISPSAVSNGMGNMSVNTAVLDPAQIGFNPAFSGLMAQRNLVYCGFYPSQVEWMPEWGGMDLSSQSINIGGLVTEEYSIIPIYLGIGFHRACVSHDVTGYDEVGNPIDDFDAYESRKGITLALAFEYIFNISIGGNLNFAKSRLPMGSSQDYEDSKNTYDFGMILQLPLFNLLIPAQTSKFRPIFTPTYSYSKKNMGKDETNEKLPKKSLSGFSVEVGINYKLNETSDLKLASFEYGKETEKDLIDYEYDWESKSEDIEKNGWSFNLLETFSMRRGKYDDETAYIKYDTEGFGIYTDGLFKLIKKRNTHYSNNKILGFIIDHLSFRYHSAEYKPETMGYSSSDQFKNQTFHSITISYH